MIHSKRQRPTTKETGASVVRRQLSVARLPRRWCGSLPLEGRVAEGWNPGIRTANRPVILLIPLDPRAPPGGRAAPRETIHQPPGHPSVAAFSPRLNPEPSPPNPLVAKSLTCSIMQHSKRTGEPGMPCEVLPRLACCGARSAFPRLLAGRVASRRKLLPLNRLRASSLASLCRPLANSSLFRPRLVAFRHD